MPLIVQYEGKSYSLTPKPMWNVETIIQNALDIAHVTGVAVSSCQLVYQDSRLDKDVPFRFLNLPSSAKVKLVTGKERVHGIQGKTSVVVPSSSRRPDETKPIDASSRSKVHQTMDIAQRESALIPEETNLEGVYLFHHDEEVALRESKSDSHGDIDYEVSEKDAYAIQASLSKKVAPSYLKTKKMREEELEQKMAAMRPVLLRIEFPNNMTAQFEVSAKSPVRDVYRIARMMLRPELQNGIRLFTTPPKAVVADSSMTVYEAGLVPAARLRIEFSNSIEQYDTILSTEAAKIELKVPPCSYKPYTAEEMQPEKKMSHDKEKRIPKWLNVGMKR